MRITLYLIEKIIVLTFIVTLATVGGYQIMTFWPRTFPWMSVTFAAVLSPIIIYVIYVKTQEP